MLLEHQPLGVDPLTDIFEGPLPFSSMNAYFALPEVRKPDFLAGLVLAVEYAPTQADYTARDRGEISERVIEQRFCTIADTFATSIDRSYEPNRLDNNPETLELRGIFYKMLRTLTAEQIKEGVEGIVVRQRTTLGQK